MLNEIWIGRYYETHSKIHTMNPISKIICLILYILLIILPFDIMLLVPILLLFFTIFLTHIPYKIYLETLNSIKRVLILIFLICLIFGVFNSLVITTKLILLVLALTVLTLTTPTTEIIYGLEKVLYPLHRFKIKTNILALNIGLSLKFVPCLIDSRNNILNTGISRGINYKSNIKNYILSIKIMLKPTITIAQTKFKNIKNMMYMRLYSIDKQRCNFRMHSWKLFDTITVSLNSMLLITLILKGLIL